MVSVRAAIATVLLTAAVVVAPAATASTKPVPPAKAVKQAEAKLKRLLKEGDDRPSVYAARFELAQALRSLDTCDVLDRVQNELSTVAAWSERTGVPVRLDPADVYNELGRTAHAQASCTEDEAQARSHYQNAQNYFARARNAAKQSQDALNEAVILYNAAQSVEAMGDLPRAIAMMEEVCAIDREYALDDNYREDYPELVRMKDAYTETQTAPEAVEQHLAALTEDKVRFSFKPQHGEKLAYRSQMHDLTVSGTDRTEKQMELHYSTTVNVAGDLVTFAMQPGESRIDGKDAKAVAAAARAGELSPEGLIASLLAQPLSFSARTSGEFVGATGLEEIRRLVLTKLDETFPTAGAEQRDRVRQMIEQLLSDAVINQQIGDEWTKTVSWWIDAELDIGDWYTLDVDAPQAVMPDSTLKYTYRFKVNRRLACAPADAKKSCVELILENGPDREQFADYLIAFTTQMAGKQPRKQVRWYRARLVEDLELRERNVIVVDPATLKTYRQQRIKVTYMPAPEKGAPAKIQMESGTDELQAPAPQKKQIPAKPPRNASAKRRA